MATNVTFNGNSLQSANIMVDTVDHISAPTRDAKLYTLSHANKSVIPYDSWQNRSIVVNGTIVDTSITALDARLDTFKGWFIGKDLNLDIDYNGTSRRYIATVNSLSISRPNNLNYATFSIQFVCSNPFGQSIVPSTILSASARTAAFYNDSFTFTGTAEVQWPTITVTYSGVTGGTSASVNIGNASTGQTITVKRTWAAGDVLTIDVPTRIVYINGISVDFTGAFPEFAPGAGVLTYTDNFTTRTFTISATYYPQWL